MIIVARLFETFFLFLINIGLAAREYDGILVARGDLGVEMSMEQLPILQKRIVNKCLQDNKPVIIAKYNTGQFSHQESSGTVVKDILDEYSRPIGHQIVQSNDMLSNVRGGLLGSNLITRDIYKKNYNTKSFRYFKNWRPSQS